MMKKTIGTLAVLAVAFCVSVTNADTFTVQVGQSWTSTTDFTVNFDLPANGGTVDSINSITIDMTHTFASDLGFSITPGGGSTVTLLTDQAGAGGADIVDPIVFTETGNVYGDTDGSGAVEASDGPFAGEGWPSDGPWSKDGWSVQIVDTFAGDGGVVNSITIDFNKNVVPEPTSALALLGIGSLALFRRRR